MVTTFFRSVVVTSLFLATSSFVPHAPGWATNTRIRRFVTPPDDSFVDVEFEKVDSTADVTIEDELAALDETTEFEKDDASKSLLDLSLELDPQWKEARIPFCDGNSMIECHLSFCVDLNGITYGIGVPCEPAVAITFEEGGKTTYMDPQEHEELVEIMASKLQELVGDDVFLKKTPKILTIAGNLDKYTANWEEELFSETADRETLMDDSNEGLDFFYDFMRRELGEEEFQKTLQESREDPTIDKEILDLFNVPGLGDQANDVEGIQEMLQNMLDEDQDSQFQDLGEDLEHEGVALKLVGFNFNDGKSYTLVKLLKPFTVVGKYVQDEDDLRFDLLTPDEEKLVIPRLEKVCQQELEDAGLSLSI